MTATHPIINDSRRVLWVVTVSEKALGLPGDASIPAGRVRRESALASARHAAAQQL